MFLIDIAGLKILYTGDYSREEDRHLVKAEIPPIRPDVLIIESTYGVQSLGCREDKELRFTSLVHSITRRGGHVLLPSFALGRAQELLLILDEYWKKHPDLHNVPIYYASSLARKCMAVYQTYIHTMNSNIRSRFAKRDNPFVFKYVGNIFLIPNLMTGLDIFPTSHSPEDGKRKLPKAHLAWFLPAQVSCKPDLVANCSSSGLQIPAMG
jgi:cleavage and polyadenylation specificity factor subunit 3